MTRFQSTLLARLIPCAACLFGLLATPPAFAYLGGFEDQDGYELSSPPLSGLGGSDVTRYNAGEYGTNNGGPGGGISLITPDTGLWRAVVGGRLLNQPSDYYVIQHPAPFGHSSPNVLGMTTGNSAYVGIDSFYEYDFDSRDFDGAAPASLSNTTVDASFWWCPRNVAASSLTSPGSSIQFQDSAGNNWFELGTYSTSQNISYRVAGGTWVDAGITATFGDFDRIDLSFDLDNDRLSFSYYETGLATTYPLLTNVPLGGDMDYLAHMGMFMAAENTKNYLDDFDFVVARVPEPSTVVLAAALGGCCLTLRRRRV